MGEAKRRKLLQTGDVQQKPTLPDLSKPRNWVINSYNPHTDTYLIENVENGNVIISCLKCRQKLIEGKIYKGYKDENKYFQIME
ncbi:hypothetical protein [uncultured Nostoc sp.]|uniref:hypothetical protein n=1 Tax=uncultured Nostoc sp. TaxID=340711 RepID=UPI0035CB482A